MSAPQDLVWVMERGDVDEAELESSLVKDLLRDRGLVVLDDGVDANAVRDSSTTTAFLRITLFVSC